ncbi:MAG: hypothetical protein R2724_08925 [Bryobacterales bacterium]
MQLVTLLRTSTNKYYRQGVDSTDDLKEGFPTTRDELFSYDGLVIGNFEAAFFTPEQQTMIREFVNQRGGTLLMLPDATASRTAAGAHRRWPEALPKLETGAAHTFAREKSDRAAHRPWPRLAHLPPGFRHCKERQALGRDAADRRLPNDWRAKPAAVTLEAGWAATASRCWSARATAARKAMIRRQAGLGDGRCNSTTRTSAITPSGVSSCAA